MNDRSWAWRFRLRESIDRSWTLIPSIYVVLTLALALVVGSTEFAGEGVFGMTFGRDAELAILQAVAGGMIAFIGFVVSVAVVVVQFGAGQYTPRLVLRFRRDPVVKHSLGVFAAPVVFALVALGEVGGTADGTRGRHSVTVFVALVLLLAALFAFFLLVARLLDLLRPRRLYRQLRIGCERAIDQVYPDPAGDAYARTEPLPAGDVKALRYRGDEGVLSAVDFAGLTRVAERADLTVELRLRIGEYVRDGQEVLLVNREPDPELSRRLLSPVILAEERTITLDPPFAIRTIVDIAIRALSPAVNDPTTAVQALDTLESLLLRLAARDLGSGELRGASGTVRVIYPAAGWEELLALALTEIRAYGAGSHQVARRLRAVLLGLRASAPEQRQAAITAQLALLDAAIARAYPEAAERALASAPDHTGLGGRIDAAPAPVEPAWDDLELHQR